MIDRTTTTRDALAALAESRDGALTAAFRIRRVREDARDHRDRLAQLSSRCQAIGNQLHGDLKELAAATMILRDVRPTAHETLGEALTEGSDTAYSASDELYSLAHGSSDPMFRRLSDRARDFGTELITIHRELLDLIGEAAQ